jgi:hypothetical protein
VWLNSRFADLRCNGTRRHSEPPSDLQLPASSTKGETACAREILATLARRAYRRPVTDTDPRDLLSFDEAGRSTATFEAGIERALRRMLVSSYFLFRVERDPPTLHRRPHID